MTTYMLRIKYKHENVNVEHYFPRGIDCSLIGFRNIHSLFMYKINKDTGKRIDITHHFIRFQRMYRLRRLFIKKSIRRILQRQIEFVDFYRLYHAEVIEAASGGV